MQKSDYIYMIIDNVMVFGIDLPIDLQGAQLNDHLNKFDDKTLEIIAGFNKVEGKELNITLNDIKTMALLGKYYAYKIFGSTQLALFRETMDKEYQKKSVAQLTSALEYWKKYVESAMAQNNNPLWTNRVGHVDWIKITEWVEDDIEIAKKD